MSCHMPISNNWAITSLKVISTSLTWTIENFSFQMKKFGERIDSPTFSAEGSDCKWCVDLYPSGDSDEDYVGLYLHLVSSTQTNGMVKYQFSLLNRRGEVGHQIKWSELCEIEPGSAWGYEKFIAKSKLIVEASDLLPNDSLTIYCEVKMGADSVTMSGQNSGKAGSLLLDNPCYSEMDLAADLHELYESSYQSDVVLITKEKKFLVHKAILSARSAFFRELLKSAESEIDLDAVKINDYDYDVMSEILRYVYSGKVKNLKLHASKLLPAAVKFCLPGLKVLCEKSFIRDLNALNVCSLLLLADLHKAEKLKQKSIEFIALNLKDVYGTPGYDLLKNSSQSLISEIFNTMAKNITAALDSSEETKSKRRRSCENDY